MNRERLIADAKAVALARATDYVAPRPRPAIPVGGEGLQAALEARASTSRGGPGV